MIYNEEYIDLITEAHPRAMGLPYSKALPDTYPVIRPLFSRCMNDRETITIPEIEVQFERARKGFLEE